MKIFLGTLTFIWLTLLRYYTKKISNIGGILASYRGRRRIVCTPFYTGRNYILETDLKLVGLKNSIMDWSILNWKTTPFDTHPFWILLIIWDIKNTKMFIMLGRQVCCQFLLEKEAILVVLIWRFFQHKIYCDYCDYKKK